MEIWVITVRSIRGFEVGSRCPGQGGHRTSKRTYILPTQCDGAVVAKDETAEGSEERHSVTRRRRCEVSRCVVSRPVHMKRVALCHTAPNFTSSCTYCNNILESWFRAIICHEIKRYLQSQRATLNLDAFINTASSLAPWSGAYSSWYVCNYTEGVDMILVNT